MKKISVVSCVILVTILLSLLGCKSEDLTMYMSMVASGSNDGIDIPQEWTGWNGEYFQKRNKEGEVRTVYFGGNQYSGTYKKSITEELNSYSTDYYYTDNSVEFGVHEKTGTLVMINFMNKSFFDSEPYLDEVENPEETALAVARETAKEFVDDLEEYELIVDEPIVRYKEKDGKTYRLAYHNITFARKINGYFTSDYVCIKVTSKGNLASIFMGDINVLDDCEMEFEKSLVQNSITEKIADIYQSTGYEVLNSNYENQKLAVTPEGYLCLVSDIFVSLKGSTTDTMDTMVMLITMVGEKT